MLVVVKGRKEMKKATPRKLNICIGKQR